MLIGRGLMSDETTECPYPDCDFEFQNTVVGGYSVHEVLAHAGEPRPEALQEETCPVCEMPYVNTYTVSTQPIKPDADFETAPEVRADFTVCADPTPTAVKRYYIHNPVNTQ